jgi:hypothetical protein
VSRRPARFTEADVRRAAKVAKQLEMAVEIKPDGTIRIVPFDAGETAVGFGRWSDVATSSEEHSAHGAANFPDRAPLPKYEKGSPEVAFAKNRLMKLLTHFTPKGEQGRLSQDDIRCYLALPEGERTALDKNFEKLWATNLRSCPFNKLERKALQALSVMLPGELISFGQISIGSRTAERLEARGFLEVRHRKDEPARLEGYVLMPAGLNAAKRLRSPF